MHGGFGHARRVIGCTFAHNSFAMKKLVFSLFLVGLNAMSYAQCAVCTKTAATLDDSAARGLNGGIMYLAFMPMTLILFIGYRWYKSNKGA